jgi:hypothetical protein
MADTLHTEIEKSGLGMYRCTAAFDSSLSLRSRSDCMMPSYPANG